MCGIAGYYASQPGSPDLLRAMTRTLTHRGPDAEGYYEQGPVHFGHRRLSVLDVAGSLQPMVHQASGLALTYNGELYNYRALRDSLRESGQHFHTQGDTEVLLNALAQGGRQALKNLRGMFAFAAWDPTTSTLLLARDQLGVKPLYYYWDGKLLVFASELKAILAHPGVVRDLDLEAINLFLECQYIPAPRSIYKHIKKLPAGHALTLNNGHLELFSYWSVDYRDKLKLDESEACRLVEQELRASVEGMLVSDVPLGAFVSGGIDSSLIAALMSDCLGKPVDTFNLGFLGDRVQSEHRQAALVARHIGARHHPLMIDPATVLGAFDQWVDIYDEPFADQAALPTMLLAAHARKQVTVVLTGEGADEVFSGYDNYRKRVSEERITQWLGAAGSPFPALIRHLPGAWRKDRILKAALKPLAERYVTIPNVFDEHLRPAVYTPEFLRQTHERMAAYAARFFDECNSADYLDRLLYVDSRLWLPDDLLTKVDRATMAYSLEARVPYLDHQFVQTCAHLDPGFKQRGRTTKYLLKKIAEKYLPHEIVHRGKQGFVMPLSEWLTGGLRPLLKESLGPNGLQRRNLLMPQAIERLLAENESGRKNHAGRLWALLVLERWFQRYAPDFRLESP